MLWECRKRQPNLDQKSRKDLPLKVASKLRPGGNLSLTYFFFTLNSRPPFLLCVNSLHLYQYGLWSTFPHSEKEVVIISCQSDSRLVSGK